MIICIKTLKMTDTAIAKSKQLLANTLRMLLVTNVLPPLNLLIISVLTLLIKYIHKPYIANLFKKNNQTIYIEYLNNIWYIGKNDLEYYGCCGFSFHCGSLISLRNLSQERNVFRNLVFAF